MEPGVVGSVSCSPPANQGPFQQHHDQKHCKTDEHVQRCKEQNSDQLTFIRILEVVVDLKVKADGHPVDKIRQRCKQEGTEHAPEVEDAKPEARVVTVESFLLQSSLPRCGWCQDNLSPSFLGAHNTVALDLLTWQQRPLEKSNRGTFYTAGVNSHGFKLLILGGHCAAPKKCSLRQLGASQDDRVVEDARRPLQCDGACNSGGSIHEKH
mmetsp:Transcript_39420/g.71031  ORF Transcript_39420/g.71031 Transcript_39420/m.71031 type:complete len:210 (-) Transcript_39420:1077-1706(-)